MKARAIITEQGNGLPKLGELCYCDDSTYVWRVDAWDSSDRITTNAPGRGNSVCTCLSMVGSPSDLLEAEWREIVSQNYGVEIVEIMRS